MSQLQSPEIQSGINLKCQSKRKIQYTERPPLQAIFNFICLFLLPFSTVQAHFSGLQAKILYIYCTGPWQKKDISKGEQSLRSEKSLRITDLGNINVTDCAFKGSV